MTLANKSNIALIGLNKKQLILTCIVYLLDQTLEDTWFLLVEFCSVDDGKAFQIFYFKFEQIIIEQLSVFF